MSTFFRDIRLYTLPFVCGCLLGIGWSAYCTPRTLERVQVSHGTVHRVIEQSLVRQVFRLRAEGLVIQVIAPPEPRVSPQASVVLSCAAQHPLSAGSFSYEQYAWSQGFTHTCSVWSLSIVSHAPTFWQRMWEFQEKSIAQIGASLHEPASSLVLSMVFGRDDALSQQIIDDFRAAGLTHVLVVSGMQMVLLVHSVDWIGIRARLFPRYRLLLIIAVGFWYVVCTGAQASIVRACLIVCCAYVLRLYGRLRGNALRILIYTATLLILWRPFQLLYDIGFELSFAAACGLLLTAPALQSAFKRLPVLCYMSGVAALSMSAYAWTAPIIFVRFHSISLIGIIANLLLAELFSFITLVSFAWSLGILLFPQVLSIFVFPFEIFLRILVACVSWCAHVPFGYLSFT